jgi:hypothetical protein
MSKLAKLGHACALGFLSFQGLGAMSLNPAEREKFDKNDENDPILKV